MKNIIIKTIRNKQKQTEQAAELFFQKPQIKERAEKKKKVNIIKRFFNSLFFVIFILIIGGIGGILTDRLIIPYVSAKFPQLNQYDIFRRVNERTTIVRTTEEIRISEPQAMVDTIKKSLPSIVQVFQFSSAEDKDGIYKGAGFIHTNDGYIITSSKNLIFAKNISISNEKENRKNIENKTAQEENIVKVKLNDGKFYSSKIIRKDDKSDIAIIKIDENNLSVLPLADSKNIELGEKLIIMGDYVVEDMVSKLINTDILSSGNKKSYSELQQMQIIIGKNLDNTYSGAAAINLKGEIVGMNKNGNIFIPINEISEFAKS